MQSDNEKMLQEIVQNTEMGKNTLDELMSLTHDQKLRDEMLRQKREYRRINQAAHTALDAIGAEAHGQSAAARMSVSMGIRTRTMMDKSTRNLATMLAEGSGQGVLDCKRAERDYPEASPGAFKLCHELGAFQSDAEETWRGFVYKRKSLPPWGKVAVGRMRGGLPAAARSRAIAEKPPLIRHLR